MQYQLRQTLPYFIKRWIFFQRSATLRPLYQFEGTKHPDTHQKLQEKVAEAREMDANGDRGINTSDCSQPDASPTNSAGHTVS